MRARAGEHPRPRRNGSDRWVCRFVSVHTSHRLNMDPSNLDSGSPTQLVLLHDERLRAGADGRARHARTSAAPTRCWTGRTRRPSRPPPPGDPPRSSSRSPSPGRLSSSGPTSGTAPSPCSGTARSCTVRSASRSASTARSSSMAAGAGTASPRRTSARLL